MGVQPETKHYRPPPCPPAEEKNFRLELTDTDELHVRQVWYRDKIVDFAIMQLVWEDGERVHVARIDCCHSMIHRHQFNQAGEDVFNHRQITAIPPDAGNRWSIVHAGYYSALGTMYEEWADNLRRWRDDR